MDVEAEAFHYDLRPEAIAQQPLARREDARLLVDRGPHAPPDHTTVAALPDLLQPGDLLVVNRTRVRRARLRLRKPTGGAAEVLLLERDGDGWEALVRPSRRIPPGTELVPEGPGGDGLVVRVGEDRGEGRRRVLLEGVADEEAAIEAVGEVPLPPYITEALADPERYQTVFGDRVGSAAAPTAGLHLTEELLDRCRSRGVQVAGVDLEIGLDTFRPLEPGPVGDHRIHTERYRVPAETITACDEAPRVVAVGTTVVRALESVARTGELEGHTDLFIRAPFTFSVVDVLLTNFHLPRSTLLVLVDAFVGPRWRELYATALEDGYRFLSFGDAMWLERRAPDLVGGLERRVRR